VAKTPTGSAASAQANGSPEIEGGELPEAGEGFSQLIKFTVTGFVGGLVLGVLLDSWGQQLSAIGQWLVRTLAGEGESLLEGTYALRQRFRAAQGTMAEAYGWGKVLGMAAPWVVDWGSRALGIDVYGVQGFYIPYLYSMSDQIGGNLSGLAYLRNRDGSWPKALGHYLRHPVLVAGLVVVLIAPVGLLAARIAGFSPTTQTYTALEAIAANLCWVPPLVGAMSERRARGPREP
jgi:hypothetical protein